MHNTVISSFVYNAHSLFILFIHLITHVPYHSSFICNYSSCHQLLIINLLIVLSPMKNKFTQAASCHSRYASVRAGIESRSWKMEDAVSLSFSLISFHLISSFSASNLGSFYNWIYIFSLYIIVYIKLSRSLQAPKLRKCGCNVSAKFIQNSFKSCHFFIVT